MARGVRIKGQAASKEAYQTDKLTSDRMSAVRPLGTRPEKLVQKFLWFNGYKYRLHRYDLPGRPDIVFPGRRKAILVHGCFWHRHRDCARATVPGRNRELWRQKFARNIRRDRKNISALQDAGWDVLVIWECETVDHNLMERRLRAFLREH